MSRTRVGGLTRAERLDWLRLIRTEQVGPITFFDLLDRYGNAAAALEAIPELAKRGGRSRPLTPPSRSAAEAELRRITAAGARLVALGEPGYPPPLARIPDPPPLLQIRGHDAVATAPAVALVGARSAALPAMRLAGRIAADLAAAGVVVVSGLARGIDAAAHDGALRAGPGGAGTMAVVAGGIDVVYPPEHAALQARIAAEGLLVAEQPPGTEPQARHFPRRNRIVAGATLATVVVEAAPRSGSLITARLAGDYGREVLAVPLGGRIRLAHHDQQLARLVHGPGSKPFATIDDVLVTLTADLALDIGGITGRHCRLGHGESRPDFPRQQRFQPLCLLLRGAEHGEDFHIAGVRCRAVEHF